MEMTAMKSKHDSRKQQEIRIGIIDDDPEVVQLIERLLEKQGYKTLGLTECIGSSAMINKFKPHFIIVDIMMPALDGHKLLQVFRNTLDQVPKVILFSGIDPKELEKIAIDMGAADFVYKGDGYFRLLSRVNLLAYDLL